MTRAIPVRDAHGDELTLYEFEQTLPHLTMGIGGTRVSRRLALCSGEPAEQVDDDTFVLVATGEKLARIR